MRVFRAAYLIFAIPLMYASGPAITLAGNLRAQEDPSSSSSPVTFQARIENNQTIFRIGEVIRLELSYSTVAAGIEISTANYDRSGRLGIEYFTVEPSTGWDDPLKAYYSSGPFMAGGLYGLQPLSAKPYIVGRDLNEWVRFTQPGRYRLVVTSTRAGYSRRSPGQSNSVLRSNELSITVIPATAEWQAAKLANAIGTLASHRGSVDPGATDGERERAVATVRYLGTPAAAEQMARRLNDPAQFQFMLGLIASSAHDAAVAALEHVLNDPLAPISSTLTHTLYRLSLNSADQGDLNSMSEKHARVVDQLIAALASKRDEAQVVSAFTVAQEAGTANLPISNSQKARLSAYLVSNFDLLPVPSQAELLEYRWNTLDPQVILPLLPKVVARYRDGPVLNEVELWDANRASAVALKHWWELDPLAARSAVLAEIAGPKPRFGADILGLLPEKELPEVDQVLADHLVLKDGHDEIVASLIARYATWQIEPQVAAFLDERIGDWRCDTQASLFAYMLRVNTTTAEPLIKRALAARKQTGCYGSLLTDVAKLHNDPLLENLAIQSLADNDPEIVTGAARYLGGYGSRAAQALLWARLKAWTSAHPPHAKTPGSRSLEEEPDDDARDALITAIATGTAWLTDEPKLTQLLTYALTDTQRSHVEGYLSAWHMSPKQISRIGDAFNVAQYNLQSLSAAIEKVKEFPRGTTFSFSGDPTSKADRDALAMFQDAAKSVGVNVFAQPNSTERL